MHRGLKWFIAVLVVPAIPALLGAPCAAAGELDEPLPTPTALLQDVAFWEKVFVKYAPDQCIFHDRDNLGIIYAVKRLPGDTPLAQVRAAKHYTQTLRAAIEHLSEGGEPSNLLERRIAEVTPEGQRFPAYYRYAMDNVRCQRGVDLGPSIGRSKQYVKMVKRVLAQKGLPTDLAYLPHLESGYEVRARSKAGARGLWQLMPATARLMGLKVSRSADYRTEPIRATQVAATILHDFYAKTGSWPLAITAYNYGINGTLRAIKQHGADYMTIRQKHRTRIFGFAARNYYASFLAVRNVAAAAEGSRAPGHLPAEVVARGEQASAATSL